MKIKNIKINSFGNLHDKDIELSDNINIVYGKNEAGKSTLLKFIINSFYGTSKNKKGREFSDYDRYKPWGREDFSGKIKYELDNGEEYEVYREFGKKNPKIFNSNLEDISKNYSIDKNLGNQFFYEQTKVDEDTFISTIASMQQEVKLEKNSQNVLIQKMANIAGSGEDNVSYKKAIDKLYKKQLDEIGTYRSHGKPINIAQSKLNDLKNKKHELLGFKDKKYNLDENKNDIDEKIQEDELKITILKQLKNINEKEQLEKEKLNYNISIIQEKEKELEDLINEKEECLKNNNFKNEQDLINLIEIYQRQLATENYGANKMEITLNKRINKRKYVISILICIIINLLLFLFIKNNNLKYVGLLGFALIALFYKIEKNKIIEAETIVKNKQQINQKVEQNKVLINLDKMKNEMTGDQISLYVYRTTVTDTSATTVAAAVSGSTEKVVSISMKHIVIGIIAGAVLACGIIFVLYLFAASLRSSEEVKTLYGIKVLGCVDDAELCKKKLFGFVDKFIIRLQNRRKKTLSFEQEVQMICANILLDCQKKECKNIYLLSSSLEHISDTIIKAIVAKCEEKGIAVTIGKDICYNAESLEKAAEVGNVVFVEKKRVALYDELYNEIILCKEHAINVIGMVVIGA